MKHQINGLLTYEVEFLYSGSVVIDKDGDVNDRNVVLDSIKVDIFNLDGSFIASTYIDPDLLDGDTPLHKEILKLEDQAYTRYVYSGDNEISYEEAHADDYERYEER